METEEIQPYNNPNHRAGFVSIVGKPNVGKSTLMNVLVGEKLSIITSKAQTTRHRIMGILNGVHEGTDFQLVYSDTPGIIKPQYKLHESMMEFVRDSLEDADVVLFLSVGELRLQQYCIFGLGGSEQLQGFLRFSEGDEL